MADRFSLVLVVFWAAGSGLSWEFSSLHCSLYSSSACECNFRPTLDALECDLARNLYGQHLAQELVVKALREFVETDYPSKPLVFSFHGWSGTGKTFLSSLILKHLYKDGGRSPHVHHFSPILDFPHAQNLDQYKENLKQWIQGNLTSCGRSLFLFEEMDKMHPGLIDVIVPFLGPSWVVIGSNYKKAIFIFISNSGGDDINQVALKFWRERRDREEIRLSDVEFDISNTVVSDQELMQNSQTNDDFRKKANEGGHQISLMKDGFWQSEIIKQKLIDVIVPFLPLRPHHVRQCVHSELIQQRLANEEDIIQSVTDSLVYIPEGERVFSSTGCKTVPSRINYYL